MARQARETGGGGGGAFAFRSLAELPRPKKTGTSGSQSLSVCVVTSEVLGPVKNGGIGTATSALIDRLAQTGHSVTVLFTQVWGGRPLCQQGEWDQWVARFRDRGIRLTAIKHPGPWNAWREKAWAVKAFLETQTFELVYFNEHHASGFYAMMAKRAGITPFKDQFYAVITHGSMEWVAKTNDQPPTHPNDIAMALMERRCAEWADTVIGPSAYLLDTYRGYGWQLPSETYVQPYLLGHRDDLDAGTRRDIDELVFFGRLEHRKGLWMFCQALDRLAEQGLNPRVTFMGRMTLVGQVPTGAFLLARAARWPFPVRLLTNYGQEQALEYLSGPGRLAVMPSLADNSPCVVYECIERAIPFVTCAGSGADEIVAVRDHDTALVPPTAKALADRLSTCLADGASSASLRFDADANRSAWDRWHRWIAANGAGRTVAPTEPKTSNKPATTRLVILIDEPDQPLGSVFSAIADNAGRLGPLYEIVLLSPRKGLLSDWIDQMFEIIGAATGTAVRCITLDMLDQAASDKGCAVIAPATARLLGVTIDRCADIVFAGEASIVSCLPTGRPDSPIVQRHSQPFGEIAEMAALDEPLTGGILVADGSAATAALKTVLSRTNDMGDWPSPADLCEQSVMHHLAAGRPYRLVPQVGMALSTVPEEVKASRWHGQAKTAARLLGLEPTEAKNLPAWSAISAAWSGRATLANRHDSEPVPSKDASSLAAKAAARGRLSTAVDSAAGMLPDEFARVRQSAIESLKAAVPNDFLPSIVETAASMQDRATAKIAAPNTSMTTLFGASDPAISLAVEETCVAVRFPPGKASQAVLVALDLRFTQHSELIVHLQSGEQASGSGLAVRIDLADQSNGNRLVPTAGPVDVGQSTKVSVDLYGVSLRATVLITLDYPGGKTGADCRITAIRAL